MKRTFKTKLAFAMLVIVSSLLLGLAASAQVKRTVTGVVRDPSGNPIPGATIKEKRAKGGAVVTDDAGNFSIKAEPGATLVISSIGYDTKEVPVGLGEVLPVQLTKNNKELSEVVVTGFGVKKDIRKVGYSVTEIKGSEVVAANNSNLGVALQGKVAGVTISQGTGGPSSSSRIQIRGNARLDGNTEPLVVIDGVMVRPETTGSDSWGGSSDFGNIIKDLNPDDYESVTVLKGSAASALYGQYALNGVLLITTKKGKAKKGIGITWNQTASYDHAYKMADLQNQFGGGISPTFAKDANGNDLVDVSASPYNGNNPNGGYSYGPAFDGHLVKDLDGRMVPWKANNPLKDFFVTGQYINTNVSADGATENGSFRVSYTNLNNSSVMPNNRLSKNSFTFHGTQKFSNVLSADASVNYTTNYIVNPINQGGGGTSNIVGGITYFMPRNADINYYKNNMVNKTAGGVVTGITGDPYYIAHLLWPMLKNNLSRRENVLLANLDLTAKFTPWLSLLVRGNVLNYNDQTETKNLGMSANFSGSTGYYELDQSQYRNTRLQTLLTATKQLNEDFNFSATIGGESNRNLGGPNTRNYTNGGLVTPGLYFISNTVATPTIVQNYNPTSRNDAAYIYGDVTWRNMLTANFSVREDFSSSLTYADGHGNYNYNYNSAGLAWVFTELPAFKGNSVLSFGKLRASIGWTGYSALPYATNSTGLYGYVGTFNNASNNTQNLNSFNDGNGNYNLTLGNQNLHNELAREIEIGADVRFFNNRLGIDVAYYKKNSKNQILSLPADQETGISARTINAGNIQNQGVEILLTAAPIRSKDFNWDMTVNFTLNRNKVIELYPGVTSYNLQYAFGADVSAYAIAGKQYGDVQTGYGFATYNGKVAGSIGQRVLGLAPNGTTGNYNTFLRSQDYDGSVKDLGTIMPNFLWGTFQTLTYKNFSLGIQVDSKIGGLLASSTSQYGSETGALKNSLFGRNAALGGVTYTDNSGVSHDDGIIPKGVLADGVMSGGVDLGGMTYADAVKNNYLKPVPAYAYYENLTQWSSGIREQSIFDNSWVALRQVSIGYNLPASVYTKVHLNGLKISLTGRNLIYIWKNAKDGINPEGLYNNQAGAFAEGGGLPLIRTMGATLNASF